MDFGGQRRDIDRGIGQRLEYLADRARTDGREVALEVDDRIDAAFGVQFPQRLENAVGP